MELSPALAEVWEALCRRTSREDMERHFCRKYGLSSPDWRETLGKALGIFQDLGFFSAGEAPSLDNGSQQENFFLRNTLT